MSPVRVVEIELWEEIGAHEDIYLYSWHITLFDQREISASNRRLKIMVLSQAVTKPHTQSFVEML